MWCIPLKMPRLCVPARLSLPERPADRGIEVMALPGSPLDPRSQGTNGLIRDGATLVQNIDDILSVLSQVNSVELPSAPIKYRPPNQMRIWKGNLPLFLKRSGRIFIKNYSKISLMTQLRLTNCVAGVMSLLIMCNLFC